jgi:hypothetical protein
MRVIPLWKMDYWDGTKAFYTLSFSSDICMWDHADWRIGRQSWSVAVGCAMRLTWPMSVDSLMLFSSEGRKTTFQICTGRKILLQCCICVICEWTQLIIRMWHFLPGGFIVVWIDTKLSLLTSLCMGIYCLWEFYINSELDSRFESSFDRYQKISSLIKKMRMSYYFKIDLLWLLNKRQFHVIFSWLLSTI